MAHDVIDSSGRATSSRGSSARNSAKVLTSRATAATRKYNKGSGDSNDSYIDWMEIRMEKLRQADAKSVALINSIMGGNYDFDVDFGKNSIVNDSEKIDELMATGELARRRENNSESIKNTQQTEKVSIERIEKNFNDTGIQVETSWGTTETIKPIKGDYEVATNDSGEVVVKLSSGGSGIVYNDNGNAMGSVANLYKTSDGIDVKGKMNIDGKTVDVRVVTGEFEWENNSQNTGNDLLDFVVAKKEIENLKIQKNIESTIELDKETNESNLSELEVESELVEPIKIERNNGVIPGVGRYSSEVLTKRASNAITEVEEINETGTKTNILTDIQMGIEKAKDEYLVGKAKVDMAIMEGLGNVFGALGFEERTKCYRRSKKIHRKCNASYSFRRISNGCSITK